MFQLRQFIASNASDIDFRTFYDYKVQREKKQRNNFNVSFEQWKLNISNYQEKFKDAALTYLIFDQKGLIGSIDLHTRHPNEKEEVQIISFHFLDGFKRSCWEILDLDNQLEIWLQRAAKSTIDSDDIDLNESLKDFGLKVGNDKVFLKLEIDPFSNRKFEQILSTDLLEKYELELKVLTHPTDDEFEKLAKLMTILLNDMNRSNNHKTYLETAENLKKVQSFNELKKNNLNWVVLTNKRKEFIGMSSLSFAEENAETVWQFMTGVILNYRNKGVTKWLKAHIYLSLIKQLPLLKEFKTDCYADNSIMVYINQSLGFKQYKRTEEWYYDRS